MNNITISGRVGKENELKYSNQGKAYLRNSIAVRRSFKREGEPDTDWFNITLFGKLAETFANYTQKGVNVVVSGRLQFDKYTDQQGQERTTHNLIVNDLSLVESIQNNQPQNNQTQQQNWSPQNNNQQPPQQNYNQQPQQPNWGSQAQRVDITPDDLPF